MRTNVYASGDVPVAEGPRRERRDQVRPLRQAQQGPVDRMHMQGRPGTPTHPRRMEARVKDMTSAERVRTLVTQAWAEWHLPPPAALVKADPALVAAEFNRRRDRFVERCERELAACDQIEAAVVAAREAM